MGLNSMLMLHLTGSVWISVLLGFTSALRGPGTVHGFIGRSLSVMCHYDKTYQTYYKYWCKGVSWSSCSEVVKTRGSEVKAGRTSIKDNHTCSCFTVTLENLREADAGVYWCLIEKTGFDPGTQVTIVPESLPPTTTIAATTGYFSTVQIPTTRLTENITSFRFLLPMILLVLLVAFLVGGLLAMWRLKKQEDLTWNTVSSSGHHSSRRTLTSWDLSRGGQAKVWKPCPMKSREKECGQVPSCTEGNDSKATMAANVKPNDKRPSPSSDQDLSRTLHVEYASVKRTSAPPTLPQVLSVPFTDTEDVSYATIKFSAQDEQAIYANLK